MHVQPMCNRLQFLANQRLVVDPKESVSLNSIHGCQNLQVLDRPEGLQAQSLVALTTCQEKLV